MKKIYIYLLAATSIMGVSCSEDWLNLNPSTSVTTDQALSTLEDIKVALNGVYRETSQHSYYGDNYWYYGDCAPWMYKPEKTKHQASVLLLIIHIMY